MFSINKLLEIAGNEIGYLEKASNDCLDSKTANAGMNNYTKYWRDLNANGYQKQPWCLCFVVWCFVQAYGIPNAKKLLNMPAFTYYTPTAANYFKSKKQWYTSNPKVGDVIFFKNSTRICHTGIVYKVDSTKVYTIEGNTNGGSTLEANGGAVAKKSYSLNYTRIAGYGRPNYNDRTTKPTVPTATIKYGSKGTQAAMLQECLNYCGANLVVDGDFGKLSVEALKKFQKLHNLDPDGEYGPLTRGIMLKEVK